MTSETSIPRIDVALRLTGDGFSPEDVTSMIGLMPTKTWRAGDLVVEGRQAGRRHNAWIFGLPYRRTYEMEALVNELLDAIEPYATQIAEAAKKFHLMSDISFGVYIYAEGGAPACSFAASTIRRIAELGVNLDIDLILTKSTES